MNIQEIVGRRTNATAITKGSPETPYEAGNETQVPTKTTKGVEIKVEFCNGKTLWVSMIDVKDSNPIELAKYTHTQQINNKPAFLWWTNWVIKRRNRKINKIKNKYWHTHISLVSGYLSPSTKLENLTDSIAIPTGWTC